MKEIKAFIHRNRLADIIHALGIAGFCAETCNLSVVNVTGSMRALDTREQGYSLEMGDRSINELKLELLCADERVDEAVRIIKENGRTGQVIAGWVYVVDIAQAHVIETE